jgi:hypothetical protein
MGDNITVAIGLEAIAEARILLSDSEVSSGYPREVRSSSAGRVMSVSTMLFTAAMIPLAADSNDDDLLTWPGLPNGGLQRVGDPISRVIGV